MKRFYVLLIFYSFLFIPVFSQKRIIFIGVDGLGARILRRASTPVWDSLASIGSYSYKVKAVLPTLSNPNWASLLMGVPTKDHKIKTNKWTKADFRRHVFCDQEKGATVPTIFRVLRERYPSENIGVFHEWKEFTELIESNIVTFSYHEKSPGLITNASNYIVDENPILTFIHLDLVDKAGHTYGYRSNQYKTAVERADSLTGILLKNLAADHALDSAIIVITSDHGFNGKGHGGRSRKLREVPLIVYGADIPKGQQLPDGINNYDLPATLAYLLNCSIPECWKGKVIKELTTYGVKDRSLQ